ncbi:MAG: hypothetical protein QOI83_1859 [Streptomycetaceae bacterium]|nr:hypothetical protein [Streptomycetaceae bacterium]
MSPGSGPRTAERRGRPRDANTDSAIIETVLRLIEEGATIGALSIERIARETGVGKATVYRRWSGKDALLVDVMKSLEETAPTLKGESVRNDLVICLEFARRLGLAKRSSAVLRNVLGQIHSNPGLWCQYHETVIATRREAMHEVLRRGVRTGEIRPGMDLDLLSDLFTGPILARAVLRPDGSLEEGLQEGLSEQIVDTVLAGVAPPPVAGG